MFQENPILSLTVQNSNIGLKPRPYVSAADAHNTVRTYVIILHLKFTSHINSMLFLYLHFSFFYSHNFDCISCESCKAFFRRNAFQVFGINYYLLVPSCKLTLSVFFLLYTLLGYTYVLCCTNTNEHILFCFFFFF